MRTTINQLNKSGGLLSPFAQSHYKTNLSNVYENAVPIKATAGNPQGELAVRGARGKFWATQYLPGDKTNVVIFDAPTRADGSVKADIELGQTVYLKRLADKQPTTFVLDNQQASDNFEVQITTESSPGSCTGSDIAPAGLLDQGFVLSNWPVSNTVPSDSPFKGFLFAEGGSLLTCSTAIGVKTGPKAKSVPQRSKTPPLWADNGDLWQDENDEAVYRRLTGNRQRPLNGPSSGTFLLRKTTDTVTKGQIVYDSNYTAGALAQGQVSLADNSVLDVMGKVAGLVTQDRNSGEQVLIQQSGEFDYTHSFTPGQFLFLGTSGNLTDTAPGPGSGLILQQIAIAGQANTIVLDIRPPVQR